MKRTLNLNRNLSITLPPLAPNRLQTSFLPLDPPTLLLSPSSPFSLFPWESSIIITELRPTRYIGTDNHSTCTAQGYDWLAGGILLRTRDLFGFGFGPLPVVKRLVSWVWRHNGWPSQTNPSRLWSRRQEQMLRITIEICLECLEHRARYQNHW